MKIKLLLFLFFLVPITVLAKKPLTGIMDSVFFRVLYRFEQQGVKEGVPLLTTDTMALEVGKEWSVYYDWLKSVRDSSYRAFRLGKNVKGHALEKNDEELTSRLRANQPVAPGGDHNKMEGKIYKHRTGSKMITIELSNYFPENIQAQSWEISDDTLMILGYMCHKAVAIFRGRTYSAWFTWGIPITDGPWKLYGLPGMILKAEDTEGLFRFEAIGLEHVEGKMIEIQESVDYDVVNFKQFQAVMRKWRAWSTVSFVGKKMFKPTQEEMNMTIAYMVDNPVKLPEMELME